MRNKNTMHLSFITERKYSGLIVDSNVNAYSVLSKLHNKIEILKNIKKIKKLPEHISKKILEIPQFEIFYENNIPYCITQRNFEKKNSQRQMATVGTMTL